MRLRGPTIAAVVGGLLAGKLAAAQCNPYIYLPPPGSLPPATVGTFYQSPQFYMCCMGPIYEWEVKNGVLPPGLSIRENGQGQAYIEGTPTTIGTYAFDVVPYSACGGWLQSYDLTVSNPAGCGTVVIDPPTVPNGTRGTPYSQQLSASGGVAPYVYDAPVGIVPPGLSLSPAGLLAGTPTAGGSFTFLAAATDAAGCSGTRTYTMSVDCPPLSLGPSPLPAATRGISYRVGLTASGGSSPYTFALVSGAMPPGLQFENSGGIWGTPNTAGVYAFSARATDTYGCSATAEYLLVVSCLETITVAPFVLPEGRSGSPYAEQLLAFGGSPPYTFSVVGGTLPPGLVLDAAGAIAGTPSSFGAWPFAAMALDRNGCPGATSYTLRVRGRPTFVSGQGQGQPNPNGLRFHDRSGLLQVDIYAYGAGQYGINVASGDTRGDMSAIALTGPGPGAVYGPQVKGFDRLGALVPKVNFYAYGTLKYGANVGAAELDADGFDEIVTGPGRGTVFAPHVRGFQHDGAAVVAMPGVSYLAYPFPSYGVEVAGGDLDGDGSAEIVTAPGPGPTYPPAIRGWYVRGGVASVMTRVAFDAFPVPGYGATVASGDVEGDAYDEIVAGVGPGGSSLFPPRFRGFDFDDVAIRALAGYDVTLPVAVLYGGIPGVGDLAQGLEEDLVAGLGPDPAATARLRIYTYDGATLTQEPRFIRAFLGGYGVNPGSGLLDY